MVWTGPVRSVLDWSGLVCSSPVHSGPVRSGLVWSVLVWSGPIWSGLVCTGLVWSSHSRWINFKFNDDGRYGRRKTETPDLCPIFSPTSVVLSLATSDARSRPTSVLCPRPTSVVHSRPSCSLSFRLTFIGIMLIEHYPLPLGFPRLGTLLV